MIYVCLIRGINVGGKNTVNMNVLKGQLQDSGYKNVITYINSGNILFSSGKTKRDISKEIQSILKNIFNVEVKVLILDGEALSALAHSIPTHFVNNSEFKADVVFYLEDFEPTMLDDLKFRDTIDTVVYHELALIHGIQRENQSRSGLVKIVGTDAFQNVTIRNVNTVRKLSELVNQLKVHA